MPLNMMQDVFIEQLNELYAAEQRTTKLLRRLARAASTPSLAATLRSHASATIEHLVRLDGVFESLEIEPSDPLQADSNGLWAKCDECVELASERGADAQMCDLLLLAVAQQAGQEEIAGYGWARTWAAMLGYDKAARALEQTLSEQKAAEAELAALAAPAPLRTGVASRIGTLQSLPRGFDVQSWERSPY